MKIQVIENKMENANVVLRELDNLLNEVFSCYDVLKPFDADKRAKYGNLARFIVEGRSVLSKAQTGGFQINYPNLSRVISNGASSDESCARLHDAVFKLGAFNTKLKELQYAVKLETDRTELRETCEQIVGDLAIFMITQFNLHDIAGGVMLATATYCEERGVTPDVFYGELLLKLEAVGEGPYGYELISEYREQLMEIDPTFVGDCEEAAFPLSAEMSKAITDGVMTIPEARGVLNDFLRQTEQKEVESLNPGNMIAMLNLS